MLSSLFLMLGKVMLKTCSEELLQTLQSLSLIDQFIKDPNSEIVQALVKRKRKKSLLSRFITTETTEFVEATNRLFQ